MPVGIGIDGDRFDAHLGAGAHDAHRDFAAVGNQYLFDQAEDSAELARHPCWIPYLTLYEKGRAVSITASPFRLA